MPGTSKPRSSETVSGTGRGGRATPVERVKLSSVVCEDVGQRIVDGVFRPGDTLPPESELALSFGVSRTVVREALQQLATFGLVQSRPKIGARVMPWESWEFGNAAVIGWVSRSPGKEEFLRHVTEMRGVIEPHAAALAARRAGEAQRAEIVAAMEDMAVAVARLDVGLFKLADERFHLAVSQASGNPLLIDFMGRLQHALRLSRDNSVRAADLEQTFNRLATGSREELARMALDYHRAVADAVLDGDETRARQAMQTLIEGVDDALEAVFAASGAAGAGF